MGIAIRTIPKGNPQFGLCSMFGATLHDSAVEKAEKEGEYNARRGHEETSRQHLSGP